MSGVKLSTEAEIVANKNVKDNTNIYYTFWTDFIAYVYAYA